MLMTCPQGTVSITKAGDTEAVSCANSPGPALALCAIALKLPTSFVVSRTSVVFHKTFAG
jgi:hypothetical protein